MYSAGDLDEEVCTMLLTRTLATAKCGKQKSRTTSRDRVERCGHEKFQNEGYDIVAICVSWTSPSRMRQGL